MNNSIKSIALTSAVTLVFGFSYGQTRYVSTAGNDASNDCSLSSSPCKTISAAVTSAIAGDSILIAPGSYSLSGTLDLTKNDLVITAQSASSKPIITSDASDVITVNATGVNISNLVFKMGLTNSTGMRGIVGTTNFDNIVIQNNEFLSTNPGGFFATGMVFDAYAILLYAPTVSNATIENNLIGLEANGNDAFGRGLGIGFNASGTYGPGGIINNNDIAAYYPIQAILLGKDLMVSNNQLKGLTMFNSPKNAAVATLDNNTFDAVGDQYASAIYTLLDIRAIKDGSVVVSNNMFKNYLTTGVFSMASQNVSIVGNTFTPSATADQFISIHANTKLQTSGTQSNTYSDEIAITGNMFNPGAQGKGTAITLADHYGANTPAFDTIIIGGPLVADKNTFDTTLGHFIQLDTLSGSSDQVNMWNPSGFGGDHTPATTMKPVTQNVIALATNNNYGFTDVNAIEAKNIDSMDVAGLVGKVILGETFPDFTSIEENASAIFATIYPNPASNVLKIAMNEGTPSATIQIIDVIGNVVYVNTIQAKEMIDVSALKSGVYFVKMTTKNQSQSLRFVKK